MDALTLAVAFAATYRATMLVTNDYLTRPIRVKLTRRCMRRGGAFKKVAYLLTCPWCASVWIGFVVMGSAYASGGTAWWLIPAAALGASGFTGVTASIAAPQGNTNEEAETKPERAPVASLDIDLATLNWGAVTEGQEP